MINSFRERFHSGLEKVRNYSLSLVSGGERATVHDICAEDSFCKDIIYATKKLDHITSLTVEEKIENIRRIGIVSWTGGPLALKKAGAQVPRFLRIFNDETIEVKIEIIKALSQICCLNTKYQNMLRTEGFLKDMIDVLYFTDPVYIELQKWIVYALNPITSDNVENQRYALEFPDLRAAISKFQIESWFVWRKNEASNLVKALYFG